MRSTIRALRACRNAIRRFIECEEGPTTVEYAIMLVFIVLVCMGTINFVGEQSRGTFEEVANSLTHGSN